MRKLSRKLISALRLSFEAWQRPGPSKVTKNPSPVVLISFPRKRLNSRRNVALWASSSSRQRLAPMAEVGHSRQMKRFYFDLVGELPARAFTGHECSSKRKRNSTPGLLLLGLELTEKPDFAKPGNSIVVRDEFGEALFDVPIASAVHA